MTVQRSMYIWEKRYNTAMLYRYPKSKKYPYEIPTKRGFSGSFAVAFREEVWYVVVEKKEEKKEARL